jgi:hypothetical protein
LTPDGQCRFGDDRPASRCHALIQVKPACRPDPGGQDALPCISSRCLQMRAVPWPPSQLQRPVAFSWRESCTSLNWRLQSAGLPERRRRSH